MCMIYELIVIVRVFEERIMVRDIELSRILSDKTSATSRANNCP